MTDSQSVINVQYGAACAAQDAADEDKSRARRANTSFMLLRPAMSIDGDQWCALYGENLHDGVAGFGKSPAEAECAFNRAWDEQLRPYAAIVKSSAAGREE